jgi:hypothetical protein
MVRKRYILKVEEIETLLKGIIETGPEETYKKMKEKALLSIEKMKDLDEMFMDMSEDLLDRARIEPAEDENSKQLKDTFYLLHSMLRNLAHEVNKIYRKNGKEKTGERFVRLISHNKEAVPSFQIKKDK